MVIIINLIIVFTIIWSPFWIPIIIAILEYYENKKIKQEIYANE